MTDNMHTNECPSPKRGAAESSEQKVERIAKFAAQGRDEWGVLLRHHHCSCKACTVVEKPMITPAECQRLVDLWGNKLGAELILEAEGASFDELYGWEMQKAWDAWCAARRSIAEAVAKKEAKQEEEQRKMLIAEKVAIEARRNLKRNEVVQKNGRVCTRLYSCIGDKRNGGAKPTTMHVSSECWSHERVDPISGALLMPHVCPFLHPGEPGWRPQWMSNRLWLPAAAAAEPNRFASLGAGHRKQQGHRQSLPTVGGGGSSNTWERK